MSKSLIAHDLQSMLARVREGNICKEISLLPPIHGLGEVEMLPLAQTVSSAEWSKAIMTDRGTFYSG